MRPCMLPTLSKVCSNDDEVSRLMLWSSRDSNHLRSWHLLCNKTSPRGEPHRVEHFACLPRVKCSTASCLQRSRRILCGSSSGCRLFINALILKQQLQNRTQLSLTNQLQWLRQSILSVCSTNHSARQARTQHQLEVSKGQSPTDMRWVP